MNSLIPLRRMIIQQKPSRVDYRVGPDTNSLFYDRAGFAGSHDEVVAKLRDIFVSDSVKISSGINCTPVTDVRTFAPQAVADALNGFVFTADMRAALLSFAMRMPHLIVRLYPMQRYGFRDHATYAQMHASYQQHGELNMQAFISEADSASHEVSRLRVLMLTYLLGLIAPLKLQQPAARSTRQPETVRRNDRRHEEPHHEAPRPAAHHNSRVSILTRIMNRIRGL